MNVDIRLLAADDIEPIAAAFQTIGWDKSVAQFERYLSEQQGGRRTVLVGFDSRVFAGYVTVVWESDHQAFHKDRYRRYRTLTYCRDSGEEASGQS
jgi:hypothetical protein